ncbi:Uncharacterised protein [Vibrio cholerae]|nr:Uncharacterised protein [Vibrio cholerae]
MKAAATRKPSSCLKKQSRISITRSAVMLYWKTSRFVVMVRLILMMVQKPRTPVFLTLFITSTTS